VGRLDSMGALKGVVFLTKFQAKNTFINIKDLKSTGRGIQDEGVHEHGARDNATWSRS